MSRRTAEHERDFNRKPVPAGVMIRPTACSILLLFSLALSGCIRPPSNGLSQVGERVHQPVSTNNAIAQAYFDEGLTLVYAFNRDQAVAAFHEAAIADPKLAIAYWGEALAEGPNINYSIDDARLRAGSAALDKADASGLHASAVERKLIAALHERFASGGTEDERNFRYRQAMERVARSYPKDDDIQTLAADSLLTSLGADHLYDVNHRPAPGAQKLLDQLQGVILRNPNHIGANHLWIHAIDASGKPELGLHSAHLLSGMNFEPAASHLTHMGSHIYMQFGDWKNVAEGNDRAVVMDEELAGSLGISPIKLDYYGHDLDFAIGAELMRGNFQAADALFPRLRGQEVAHIVEYDIFEEAWDRLRSFPEPVDTSDHLIWRFGHVLTDIHARDRAALLQDHAAFIHELPANATQSPAETGMLTEVERGSVAYAQGRPIEGKRAFTHALVLQVAQPLDKLPSWRFPVARQFNEARASAGSAVSR